MTTVASFHRDLDQLAATADVRGEPPRVEGWRFHASSHFYAPYLVPALERQVQANRHLVAHARRVLRHYLWPDTDGRAVPSARPSENADSGAYRPAPMLREAKQAVRGRVLGNALALAGPLPDAGDALGALHHEIHGVAAVVAGDAEGEQLWLALADLARRTEEAYQVKAEYRAANQRLDSYGMDPLDRTYHLRSDHRLGVLVVTGRRWLTRDLWQGYVDPFLDQQARFNEAVAAWLHGPTPDAHRRVERALPTLPTRFGPLAVLRRALLDPLSGYVTGVIERQHHFNRELLALLGRAHEALLMATPLPPSPLPAEAAALARDASDSALGDIALRVAEGVEAVLG